MTTSWRLRIRHRGRDPVATATVMAVVLAFPVHGERAMGRDGSS
jgi:hypothetical protein